MFSTRVAEEAALRRECKKIRGRYDEATSYEPETGDWRPVTNYCDFLKYTLPYFDSKLYRGPVPGLAVT